MEVLNLATKEKQDEILSNFPINGGENFEGLLQINNIFVSTYSNVYTTLSDVSGEGILLSLTVAGNDEVFAKITIDGSIVHDNRVSSANFANMLAMFSKFNTELKVEIKTAVSGKNVNGTVTFLLK